MNRFDPAIERATYVRRLLDSYRCTPTTAGRVRPADRRLANQLYDRRVPLDAVQAAFHLAAARRIFRDFQAPPLVPIQSLHYFLPVLDEVRSRSIDPDYLVYLAWKVQNADAELQKMREAIARRTSRRSRASRRPPQSPPTAGMISTETRPPNPGARLRRG